MKSLKNPALYNMVKEDETAYGELMKYKISVPSQCMELDMFDPDPNLINEGYMALCLGRINRYNGGTYLPISVAEHCLHVAYLASLAGDGIVVQLACLLHDAGEAYYGDIVKPIGDILKKEFLPFSNMKDVFDQVIMNKFLIDYTPELHQLVKKYDELACQEELEHDKAMWEHRSSPVSFIRHLSSTSATNQWLDAVTQLHKKVKALFNDQELNNPDIYGNCEH